MARPALLVALLLAVALAPALAVPRPLAVDEPSLGGWGARAPAWQDPGGRVGAPPTGDAPRALPPAQRAAPRARPRPAGGARGVRRAPPTRSRLATLGKRQADGG